MVIYAHLKWIMCFLSLFLQLMFLYIMSNGNAFQILGLCFSAALFSATYLPNIYLYLLLNLGNYLTEAFIWMCYLLKLHCTCEVLVSVLASLLPSVQELRSPSITPEVSLGGYLPLDLAIASIPCLSLFLHFCYFPYFLEAAALKHSCWQR